MALHILLVEDNPRDARLVEIALSEMDADHRMHRAPGLAEAAAAAQRDAFDLVLLDLGLGETDGIETLEAALRVLPDKPIVVVTGMADEDIGTEAVRLGAQDYLVKGRMTGELLARALRYAVERHRILVELQVARAKK